MIESQRHIYHLVDPSQWAISGSHEALETIVGGVGYTHWVHQEVSDPAL